MNPPTNAPPQKSAQLIQQGLFHHRQGQLQLAMDRYTEVLRNDPRNADALYYIAVVACQEGQFKQGIELGRRAISSGAAGARVHNLMGQAFQRLGQPEDALKSYDNALVCDINFAEAYGNRASILAELGRPAEALPSFEKALALKPDSVSDWVNKGAALQDLGRQEDALASYDKALALAPNFAAAHMNRAQTLRALGRNDDALAALDTALAQNPMMVEFHRVRAALLKDMGRADEAQASLDKAAELEADIKKMEAEKAAREKEEAANAPGGSTLN